MSDLINEIKTRIMNANESAELREIMFNLLRKVENQELTSGDANVLINSYWGQRFAKVNDPAYKRKRRMKRAATPACGYCGGRTRKDEVLNSYCCNRCGRNYFPEEKDEEFRSIIQHGIIYHREDWEKKKSQVV
ncbi:MAG: hypothetical protein ACXADY_24005 [Candidatus Hodarchaeales archaeon]|jgi:tRNA(Ile2) C34 agmatinyltransferase TiaS